MIALPWKLDPPRTRFQTFPVCHRDGFNDGKHQKRSTLADAVRKGEIRTGVGTGAVDGYLGEERIERVKSKDRVHVSECNAVRKC